MLKPTIRYTSRGAYPLRASVVGLLLVVLLIAMAMFALTLGPVDIPVSRVLSGLMASLGISEYLQSVTEQGVVQNIRLPRILSTVLVGGSLAVSGAIMQAMFRNHLAEPGLLGISAGASLGAVTAIGLGLSAISAIAVPALAFTGALVTIVAVQLLAKMGGQYSMPAMLLAGIVLGSFAGGAVSTIIVFTREFNVQREMIFWLAGGFHSVTWASVWLLLPAFCICTIAAIFFARDLNLFTLGEDQARALGVNTGLLRVGLVTVVALTTGVAVAIAGVIGFVGLVAPHIVRLMVGHDNRFIIPLSIFIGALFLLVVDTFARTIVTPAELPVGVITALIGAPFFAFILIRYRSNIYEW